MKEKRKKKKKKKRPLKSYDLREASVNACSETPLVTSPKYFPAGSCGTRRSAHAPSYRPCRLFFLARPCTITGRPPISWTFYCTLRMPGFSHGSVFVMELMLCTFVMCPGARAAAVGLFPAPPPARRLQVP